MAVEDAVRVGFVGVGGRARSHLAAVSTVEGAQIVAVTDIDGERARSVADQYGAAAYTNTEEMLDAQPIDAVWVVTPPSFHREPVVEAATRGVNVYLEKPVALNLSDALAMEAAAKEAGIICAVSYQIRYLDTVAEVHRSLDSKDLALLNAHYYWRAPRAGGWQRQTSASGGQIVEQATHLVDLMRYWAGDIETVHSLYALRTLAQDADFGTWDANVVNFGFKSGAVGSLATTYALFPDIPEKVISKAAKIDLIAEDLLVKFTYRDLEIYTPDDVRQVEPSIVPDEAAATAFINAVRTGDTSKVLAPITDANHTLAVTLAANESALTREPIRVDDFRAMHSAKSGNK